MCGRGFASLALFPLRFNHALPTDSPRMTGATRSAKPPKTERGTFRLSKLAEKLPRSVYRAVPCGHFASLVRSTFGLRDFPPNRRVAAHLRRICGGRRPRSNEAGTIPRTANRVSGVVCASRGLRAAPCGHFAALPLVRSTFGLRGFPPNRRFAPHLRRIFGFGYSRLTARIVPRDGDACGTRPRTTTERGAARSVVAARGAALCESRLRGKTANPATAAKRGAWGTWRCVCNAGKPCGPKRSADGRARQPG